MTGITSERKARAEIVVQVERIFYGDGPVGPHFFYLVEWFSLADGHHPTPVIEHFGVVEQKSQP